MQGANHGDDGFIAVTYSLAIIEVAFANAKEYSIVR
jgi:hypothetical protein